MDRDVLAQLYERYYQPALFYLLALCRDRHLAEDLVQEAFVRALDGSRVCPAHVDAVRFLGKRCPDHTVTG